MWLLITWSVTLHNVIIGLAAALFIGILMGDIFTENPGKFKDIKRYLWMLVYIPYYIWQCILANFDVAYRVLHPRMPIRPGVLKIKTLMKSDSGKAFLANSLSLIPGITSLDITDDGYLYLHLMNVKQVNPEEECRKRVAKLEYFLMRIYD